MKSQFTAIVLLLSFQVSLAQNVGIGTTSPTGPLAFSSVLGNKIVLWGDGTGSHYGIGVQSGQLQFYSDASSANIVFGYGRSTAFNERMRIINNTSYDGMQLNGRIVLKNGSNDLVGGGAGVWMYKADNSDLLGFMGAQNNQNVGFFGGPAGWGFTYDAINSRVGIGNNNPNAPLAFGASSGKKITLYPGGSGDAGFGISPNRLQIFSDNPNADVAIGYDAAGTFNERFAVKPNGALAVVANTGLAGQVLSSGGSNSAAQWRGVNSLISTPSTGSTIILPAAGNGVLFSGSSIVLNLARSARVLFWIDVVTTQGCVFYPCGSYWKLFMTQGANVVWSREIPAEHIDQTYRSDSRSVGPIVVSLAAGVHNFGFSGHSIRGEPTVTIYPTAMILSD